MFKKLIIASAFSSFMVNADVTITLPDEINILAINENKAEAISINSKGNEITLPDGNNQIVYKVNKIFNKGSSQSKKFSSSPFIITINAHNENLTLSLPVLNDSYDARKFNKSPQITLTSKNGNSYEFHHEKLELEGYSINHDYISQIKEFNKKDSRGSKENTLDKNSIKNDLITLFKNADKETQKEFLSWAIENI